MFDVDLFRTYMNKAGVIRTSHFTMTIPKPPGLKANSDKDSEFDSLIRELGFAIEATNLPGISMATDEVRRYGYGVFEKKPYVPIFADVNFRAICDREGKIYDFFQSWLKLIINYDSRKSKTNGATGVGRGRMDPYEIAYKSEYAADVVIQVYNEYAKEVIKVTLLEAYPIFMGDVNLNWGDTNSIVRLPITMTFRDWYQERDIYNPDQPNDTPNSGSQKTPESQTTLPTPNK